MKQKSLSTVLMLFLVLLVVNSLTFITCTGGEDDDDDTPTMTPTATPSPTITPTQTPPPSTFAAFYGGSGFDIGYAGLFTAGGGHIFCGIRQSPQNDSYDGLLIKTDRQGSVEWEQTYGGTGMDVFLSVIETADGGFLVVGYSTSSPCSDEGDGLIVKYSASGSRLWDFVWDGGRFDSLTDCAELSDGRIAACGYSTPDGSGFADVVMVMVSAEGIYSGYTRYSGQYADFAFDLEQTQDGGFIIAGTTASSGSGWIDMLVLRLDGSTNVLWQSTFGGANKDEAYAIREMDNGDFIVTGYTYSNGSGSTNDCYIVRMNSQGGLLWARTYGGSRYETGFAILRVPSGDWLIAGYTDSSGFGFGDMYLLLLNENGERLWERTIGYEGEETAYALDVSEDGFLLLTGGTDSRGNGNFDLFTVRTDQQGNFAPPPASIMFSHREEQSLRVQSPYQMHP